MTLSRQERETIINFNEGEDTANIYTCSKSWMCHMEDVLGLKPTNIYGSHAKEYEIPKTWVRKPHKPRQLSEEQKQKLRQRLPQKSILNQDLHCAVGKTKSGNDKR